MAHVANVNKRDAAMAGSFISDVCVQGSLLKGEMRAPTIGLYARKRPKCDTSQVNIICAQMV